VKKHTAWWLYQKRILQACDLIVVNSTQEKKNLRDLGLTPPIATIPNGVDFQGFPSEHNEREPIILFLSRIDPKKGVPDLIKAWSSLRDRKGYRLHIHGHGDQAYLAKVNRLISACRCDDLALLPPVFGPARWDVFMKASVYVLPSYSENFGITVAEALSAGLPVITTRATPWNHLASDGLGWIIDNDIEQLSGALRSAIDVDFQTLSDMREKAQIYAKQRFDWSAIAHQYAEIYSWILNGSAIAPACVDRD
jgi:glycosyltransferase involved in cell wall biosynthesis